MPRQRAPKLPSELHYLQNFVDFLAGLPAEEINEDIDIAPLETALRKRLKGLKWRAAKLRLSEDTALLREWLGDKPDHPAHWVLGVLLYPGLAKQLTQPPEPPPRGPRISFDAPPGWKVTPVPFRLDLAAAKVVGSIMAIDEIDFNLIQRRKEQPGVQQDPVETTMSASEVALAECRGKKYVIQTIRPIRWKQVEYALAVPGGFAHIMLGTLTGEDFDELPLETKLHTLQISSG